MFRHPFTQTLLCMLLTSSLCNLQYVLYMSNVLSTLFVSKISTLVFFPIWCTSIFFTSIFVKTVLLTCSVQIDFWSGKIQLGRKGLILTKHIFLMDEDYNTDNYPMFPLTFVWWDQIKTNDLWEFQWRM